MTEHTVPPIAAPEVRILRLRPGDILVAKFDGQLSAQMAADAQRMMQRAAPGSECLIIDGNTELFVVRKEDASDGSDSRSSHGD